MPKKPCLPPNFPAMFAVQWTQEAEEDLDNILLYYLENAGELVAESIFGRIHAQVGSLQMFPERCRIGRVPGTKEYVISRLPYIAVVKIEPGTVWVLNVIHTARKFPAGKPL